MSTDSPVHVVVTAAPGTRLGAVLPSLAELAGVSADVAASVDGHGVISADVLGRGHLVDGARLLLSPRHWPPTMVDPPGGGTHLVCTTGPDAGRSFPVRPGRLTLGRLPSCDVVLTDPGVSRRQGTITITPSGVEVVDLGGRNPMAVIPARGAQGGAPAPITVTSLGTRAALGDVLVLGSTSLELRATSPPIDPSTADQREDGTSVHAGSHRRQLADPAVAMTVPAPPVPGEDRRIPWLAAVLPLGVSVPMALWWGSPVFLIFGALGPALAVGTVVADRRAGGRRSRRARREHEALTARILARARTAAADAVEAERIRHPDLGLVLDAVQHRRAELWAGRPADPDALVVRVGTAALPGPVRIRRLGEDSSDPCGSEAIVVSGAPLTVDLAGGVAVAGPPSWVDGVARAIVGRLVATLGPDALRLQVVTDTTEAEARWAWAGYLPHARPDVDAHRPLGGGPTPNRPAVTTLLVLADEAVASSRPRCDSATALLALVSTHSPVPAECATVLRPGRESGATLIVSSPDGERVGVAEPAGSAWASRLAHAMAPLRPAAATASSLPDSVSLQALLRGRLDDLSPTSTEVAEWWTRGEARTGLSTPLGVSAEGPYVVDLVSDGPHGLVGGTTGAGKSELLRSLAVGLACRHPPERLWLLLVDFKGGAAFGETAHLPHTVDVLTDLDPKRARRVLEALRGELRRRELVLAEAGSRDAADLVSQGEPRLARLLIVVDEFRVLAEECPDVLEGLVRIATVGRSLGVHLILATQRPAGVVSADIRANTALRIALRVSDASESRDLVNVPDAADLPARRPGRAIVHRAGKTATVQMARIADTEAQGRPLVRRRLASREGGPARRVEKQASPAADAGADQAIRAIVAACEGALRSSGRSPASAPWRPPLPARVDVDGPWSPDERPPARGPALVFAVADLPFSHRQCLLAWNPEDDGPLTICGALRSGRTTALTTVALAAAAAGLSPVVLADNRSHGAPFPFVDWTDPDHLADVLAHLHPVHGMCLVLDDADALVRHHAERPELVDAVSALLRGAVSARVPVALSGGHLVAAGRLVAPGRLRVVLRPGDASEAVHLGVRPVDGLEDAPAGRCLVLGSGLTDGPVEAQVVWPEALRESHRARDRPQVPGPPAVPPAVPLPAPLPDRVDRAALTTSRWPHLALGIGSRGQVAVDVRSHPVLVVAGSPTSGRTTALRTLALAADDAGADVLVVAPRNSDQWPQTALLVPTAADGRRVVETRTRAQPLLVVLDDLDRGTAEVDEALVWFAARTDPGGVSAATSGGVGQCDLAVVASATTSWLAASFRGSAAVFRRAGAGLLLQPRRHDARDVLGVPAPALVARVAGRGFLVLSGDASRLQVAAPGDPSAAAPTDPRPPLVRSGG
jgi:S-DNA-T family DNA segregation ATPase FtsK/SpoIIIE